LPVTARRYKVPGEEARGLEDLLVEMLEREELATALPELAARMREEGALVARLNSLLETAHGRRRR
jgi:hypothetical protein